MWLRLEVRRTLDKEAADHYQYQVMGRSLDNGGCIAEPPILVDRCWVFLCILHSCMAIDRLAVAFVKARLEVLPKENGEAVQRLLYRARKGVKPGASAAPDREEARALFLAWEEMGPLLAYAPDCTKRQTVLAMTDLLRDLYSENPPREDLGASTVAREYRAHCRKAACQSNYLLYLEEDVTTALANAARLGVRFGGGVCGCGTKSNHHLETGLQRHMARGGWGGMPGVTSLEREAEVVLQVRE